MAESNQRGGGGLRVHKGVSMKPEGLSVTSIGSPKRGHSMTRWGPEGRNVTKERFLPVEPEGLIG